MTRIKICGLTLPDDAARAATGGADFVGLNFWPRSKRYITPDRAPLIASIVRSTGSAKIVGVFVDAEIDEIQSIASTVDLDIIQLHGDESPDYVKRISLAVYRPVWKALAIASSKDLVALDGWPAEAILLDAPSPGKGGAGVTFDWKLAREARERYPKIKFVLAGGLTPDNVTHAIQTVEPWAIDVASGVEVAPGIKDPAKLDAFIGAARLIG